MLLKCWKNKFCACFFLVSFFLSFTLGAADFLLDWDVQTYDTRHFWNKHGKKKHSFNHFNQTELQLYTELRLFPGSIFSALGSYASIHDRLNGNTYGFGDVEASWTFQPLMDCFSPLWMNLTAVVPAGGEKDSLRYGRWAVEFDLFYSDATSIYNLPVWYYFGLGYRGYFGFPSDQIKAIVNTAAALTSNIFLYFIGDIEWGLFNGRRKEHFNQILLNPNYRLCGPGSGLGGLSDGIPVCGCWIFSSCVGSQRRHRRRVQWGFGFLLLVAMGSSI